MEAIGVGIVWILGIIVTYMILQSIILGAINHSKLAHDVNEIKALLSQIVIPESKAAFDEATREKCPGCGSPVLKTAIYCSACGLRLHGVDEDV
ncbi:zinc ribbon domain-containing protein [Paenibacillus sp. GCM10027626]|uniref:zinc ribbon domain-containing protein n=1 Tax=Paenibacillus sp. GCM10027626 TaxID=3273411 RepID=UPI003636A208